MMDDSAVVFEKPVTHDPLIVRLLSTLNCLDSERLEALYDAAAQNDTSFEEVAIQSGLADEKFIAQAYANHYLMPMFDPPANVPPPIDISVSKILPSQVCLANLIAPITDDGQTIEVAIFSPDSLLLADEIKLTTGRQMRPMFTTLSVIRRLLSVMYEGEQCIAKPTKVAFPSPSSSKCWFDGHTPQCELAPQAATYLSNLIDCALHSGARDIHIEPISEGHRVRLRIDQTLVEHDRPCPTWSTDMVGQLSSLGRVDSSDPRLPQEGLFQLNSDSKRIDVRINTCPTMSGQKTVLRLIDRDAIPRDLVSLGLEDRARNDLGAALHGGSGLVLVVGATGSGRSTTLAACLNEFNHSCTNLCTVEENIDSPIAGVNQVLVRPELGLTYAGALRGLLRQDPDVILVGEIDMEETAKICFRAASGRQLILSSMCQPDAVGGLVRLHEMGIDRSSLSQHLRCVVGQRMIRRLCDQCKAPQKIEPDVASRFGIKPSQTLFGPVGCDACRQTGYRGQMTIFEVLAVTRKIADLVEQRETRATIRTAAMADGVKLLRQTAVERAIAGETSLKAALSLS